MRTFPSVGTINSYNIVRFPGWYDGVLFIVTLELPCTRSAREPIHGRADSIANIISGHNRGVGSGKGRFITCFSGIRHARDHDISDATPLIATAIADKFFAMLASAMKYLSSLSGFHGVLSGSHGVIDVVLRARHRA